MWVVNRQLCGLSTGNCVGCQQATVWVVYRQYNTVLHPVQNFAPFLYYLSCVYFAPEACNYGENYLTAKICLELCERPRIRKK